MKTTQVGCPIFAALALVVLGLARGAEPTNSLSGRVVFLGDSITYSGEYVEFVEAGLRLPAPAGNLEIINVGLPSETVSGLSEPGHAGGAFPRPDLHERLDRILRKTRPNVVVACYGMNDGIYYPLGGERFKKFQDGMVRLHEKVVASGSRIIHVTPPVFDPLPIKTNTLPAGLAEYRLPFVDYNQVLDRYSDWLLAQRAQGWTVVDAHGPMNRYLAAQRQTDPAFCLARDGVHPNAAGHWLIARALLKQFGASHEIISAESPDQAWARFPSGAERFKLIHERQRLLLDAWLTDIGHQRPGMAKGLPLDEAQAKAAELDAKFRTLGEKAPGQ